MTKILLFADNRTNLIAPLLQEIEEKKYDVTYVDASELGALEKYPTLIHRIKAKLWDELFFRRKRNWGRERFVKELCKERFDHIVILIPAMLSEPVYHSLQTAFSEKLTCVFWDSLNKAPAGKIALKFCTNFFSFDKEDCKYQGVKYLATYIDDSPLEASIETLSQMDFFGVFGIESASDRRYQMILKFAEANTKLKGLVHFVSDKLTEKSYTINNTQIVQSKYRLIGGELNENILDAHCILDIVDERQTGLSPRIGSANRFQRKLITNNESVLEETWFKENTFLISRENLKVPLSFIQKEFVPTQNPNGVSNWLEKVLYQ